MAAWKKLDTGEIRCGDKPLEPGWELFEGPLPQNSSRVLTPMEFLERMMAVNTGAVLAVESSTDPAILQVRVLWSAASEIHVGPIPADMADASDEVHQTVQAMQVLVDKGLLTQGEVDQILEG